MGLVPARHRAQAEALLAITEPVAGVAPIEPEYDYENFWEAQFKLAAALTVLPSDRTWFQRVDGNALLVPTPVPGNETAVPPAVFGVVWGPGPETVRGGLHGHHRERDVFPYWENQAFLAAAGRQHLICGVDPDDGSLSLSEASVRLAAAGYERQFLKGVQSKTLATAGAHSQRWGEPGFEPDDDSAGWALVHLDGSPESLVLQPYTHMHFEYRFFVVRGVPVCGAGTVSEHTPFDGTGLQFETRMRRAQTPDEPVVDSPARTARYVQFAGHTAAAIYAENSDWGQFVLDVATNADGNPIIVELNSTGASGLFASNPEHFARALMG